LSVCTVFLLIVDLETAHIRKINSMTNSLKMEFIYKLWGIKKWSPETTDKRGGIEKPNE